MTGQSPEDRHQCHTDPGDIETAREWIRDTLSSRGVGSHIQRDLTLAFTEITSNLLPRVQGRPQEDKVEILLSVSAGNVQMSIIDSSPPFEPGTAGDEDREGGMGVLLLNVLADEVVLGVGPAGGSVTTVVKRLDEDRDRSE